MQLFIDTNIFFTFFNLSSESIDELKKALVLHEHNRLTLWLPEQVEDEFWRNRESVINQVISEFKKESQNGQVPQIVRYSDKADELIHNLKEYKRLKQDILKEVSEKIEAQNLEADIAINEIFESGEKIERTQEIIDSAVLRYDLGNPPGKKGSYGDAVNWLSLLQAVPDDNDLHIVTDDGDYFSELHKDQANEFLRREWKSKKNGELYVYKRLSQYISKNHPEATNVAEIEKNIAIENLQDSGSFQRTHSVISELISFDSFSQSQAMKIIEAYLINEQVNWIAKDPDVKTFGEKIAEAHKDHIEEEKLNEFLELFE